VKRLRLLLAVSLLGTLLTVPSAAAGDTQCIGTLTGTFDNVVVPAGAQCRLVNSTVHGNVLALPDSHIAISNSRIAGNVQGDKADLVQVVNGSNVGGSVWAKEGGPAPVSTVTFFICSGGGPFTPCEVAILGSTIGGNVQVEKMTGDVAIGDAVFLGLMVNTGNIKAEENLIPAGSLFQIRNNRVAGNLQVFKNTGGGTKSVQANVVAEDLQCFENTAPFVGGPNTAQQSQGQCF
jgi:hypothetical protein